MGNAVREWQGTEAKTHQPELQADGPPSSTSTFHTHASSETALHTRCVCVPLYFLRMMSTQCLQKRRLRRISLFPVHPSKRNPARVSSYYMATATAYQSNKIFMYGVFRPSVMIDIAHVSSHTATQDRHGHTPRHCWHTTHPLGSTEHPPFACSHTTHSSQPPQSTIRSAYTTPHQRATQCEYARQGTEAKTHEPELQADGPPWSTSTFHIHALEQ